MLSNSERAFLVIIPVIGLKTCTEMMLVTRCSDRFTRRLNDKLNDAKKDVGFENGRRDIRQNAMKMRRFLSFTPEKYQQCHSPTVNIPITI